MIFGAFFIRPIPLHKSEEGQGHLEGISSESGPHDGSHTPLLDYAFAEGVHSNHEHRTGINDGHFDESYTLDDVPSHRDDEDVFAQPNRNAKVMLDQKPNLHGKHLWLSGDFWLLFTILAIRKSTFSVLITN